MRKNAPVLFRQCVDFDRMETGGKHSQIRQLSSNFEFFVKENFRNVMLMSRIGESKVGMPKERVGYASRNADTDEECSVR